MEAMSFSPRRALPNEPRQTPPLAKIAKRIGNGLPPRPPAAPEFTTAPEVINGNDNNF